MNTMMLIISSIFILILLAGLLIYNNKKASFKIIIEKGVITERSADIPSEFLYDI